jgi:hypothetical protein
MIQKEMLPRMRWRYARREKKGKTSLINELLLPNVSRRTLQRDLKILVDKKVLVTGGSTHHISYRLNNT